VEIGDCGAAGWVYKGVESGREGIARAKMRAEVAVRLVSCSDTRWKTALTTGPHPAVSRSAGPPCQWLLRGGKGRAQLLGRERARGRSEERKGGKEVGKPRGGRRSGLSPRVGRQRGKSFPFSKFIFCSILFERNFKII